MPGTTRLLALWSLQSTSKQIHQIISECDKCQRGKEDVLLYKGKRWEEFSRRGGLSQDLKGERPPAGARDIVVAGSVLRQRGLLVQRPRGSRGGCLQRPE